MTELAESLDYKLNEFSQLFIHLFNILYER